MNKDSGSRNIISKKGKDGNEKNGTNVYRKICKGT